MDEYVKRSDVHKVFQPKYAPAINKTFAAMIDSVPAADVVERPRWIPVTERCPEKSGDYLVFDDCSNLYVNEWHCLLKKWQYDDSRITHWMPLPEPPKEET